MAQFDPRLLDLSTSTLTPTERRERRRATSRLSMESRRRAVAQLIKQYPDEYDEYYRAANLQLRSDPKYRT